MYIYIYIRKKNVHQKYKLPPEMIDFIIYLVFLVQNKLWHAMSFNLSTNNIVRIVFKKKIEIKNMIVTIFFLTLNNKYKRKLIDYTVL